MTTIRLPFGEHYGAPLAREDETRWTDGALLGPFECAAGDEPGECAYAECALLSAGWAIRFVAVGIVEARAGTEPRVAAPA